MEAFVSYLKFTLGLLLGCIIVAICLIPFIATVLLCTFVSWWFAFLFIVTFPLSFAFMHTIDNSVIADKLFEYFDSID